MSVVDNEAEERYPDSDPGALISVERSELERMRRDAYRCGRRQSSPEETETLAKALHDVAAPGEPFDTLPPSAREQWLIQAGLTIEHMKERITR